MKTNYSHSTATKAPSHNWSLIRAEQNLGSCPPDLTTDSLPSHARAPNNERSEHTTKQKDRSRLKYAPSAPAKPSRSGMRHQEGHAPRLSTPVACQQPRFPRPHLVDT